jgi:sigma-B regulation protein RsbU (phosphoserine phosphatase)
VPIRAAKNQRVRLYGLIALVLLDVLLQVTGKATALSVLITLVLAAYGLFRLGRLALKKSKLIWRLRNRLIVTYVFVGAVPIVLILALAYCGAWIVVGQVATYLVSSELGRRAAMLENPARFLSQVQPSQRNDLVTQLAPLLWERAPGLEMLAFSDDASAPVFRCPPQNALEPPLPEWKDYTGIVLKNGAYYTMSLVRTGSTRALLLAPLSPAVLESLVPGIGALSIYNYRQSTPNNVDLVGKLTGTVPPAYTALDFEYPWYNPLDVAIWEKPNQKQQTLLSVSTRPSAVLSVVFSERLDFARGVLLAFVAILCLLALVELISVIISATMTRNITGAVHNIYEGTLRIGRGDFSHRIPVRGHDQMADLGTSFNQMTAQLENLLVVAKEKERLQSELDIASEVQNQLFPRSAPPTRTIELIGACEPARSVSGDYYDYLCLPDGNLALAIGDVAGKGISAALLMASIQSIMRTQLAAGVPVSTAQVVEQVNRQLYANTAPEKYATFFFGLYDDRSRVLTYTNAGHLSPLLVCGEDVRPLEVTGTVVGLFASVQYEEERISLCPDDLLIAYTDGITEPENAYGEEFGAERLAEAVLRNRHCEPREMVAKVMEAVKLWSHAPELPDDMTVMIARGINVGHA